MIQSLKVLNSGLFRIQQVKIMVSHCCQTPAPNLDHNFEPLLTHPLACCDPDQTATPLHCKPSIGLVVLQARVIKWSCRAVELSRTHKESAQNSANLLRGKTLHHASATTTLLIFDCAGIGFPKQGTFSPGVLVFVARCDSSSPQ